MINRIDMINKKVRVRFLFIGMIIFLSLSFVFKTNEIMNRHELLSGSSFKKWNIIDNYPKVDSVPSCNFPNNHSFDNTWKFNNDHSFSFNPGLVLKSDTTSVNSCKDLHQLEGTWQLIDVESKIKIQVLRSDNIQISDSLFVLFEIEKLVQDTMILIDNENFNNKKYVFTTKE